MLGNRTAVLDDTGGTKRRKERGWDPPNGHPTNPKKMATLNERRIASMGFDHRWAIPPVERQRFPVSSRFYSPDQAQSRLAVQFTCGVCGHRQGPNTFSRNSYEKGVVIITCDQCHNHHIIADNLGWFKDFKGRNIEEVLRNRGIAVKKGVLIESDPSSPGCLILASLSQSTSSTGCYGGELFIENCNGTSRSTCIHDWVTISCKESLVAIA
ncbi:hypothetical protein KIN20_016169 [Parelaphostrongylus tenuis]|uniref:DNL-type domain-containing protein n=1 Tax=Parelaphostrongylus tenuis TaxID=148309 RepID=A0AAD5N1N3_PARTN|nr:hypothetical protein KIN20_016169 [Parelaphostrongylus tenuis]